MDAKRFDDLVRTFGRATSRRSVLGGLIGGLAAAVGLRGNDALAQCGNVICLSDPAVCGPGCVCCLFPNGNNRCLTPTLCARARGTVVGDTTTTTTTPSPTTTTTTTAAPTTTTTTTTTTTPPPTTTTTTTAAPTTTTTTTPPPTTTTTTTAAPEPVSCPNILCADEPSVCGEGCECCLFQNGNNRCLAPGICEGAGGTVLAGPIT